MPQRKALLELARDRLENFYANKGNLEDPKEADGIVFRLSKADKSCAGDMVPLTFLEFDVPNARPVDVFNVIMAAENETQWDKAPSEMRVIGEWKRYQARGVVGFFDAKPLSTREIHEWQVASANFTSEEFWVVYSTLENDQLRNKEPLRAGATEMQNCLCAYRITPKAGGGVHVLNTQQINEHPWPLNARSVANLGWQTSAAFGSHLRAASEAQEKKGWAANKTVAPAWMLKDGDCALERPDESLRESLLSKAYGSFNGSWEEPPKTVEKLADGKEMKVWQLTAECGGAEAPLFHAEFSVDAGPQEVFNAIAAKRREAQWNPRLQQLNISGFSDPGVRSVHEEFSMPSVMGLKLSPREMFEFQAAERNSSRYLLTFSSDTDSPIPSFNNSAVKATQCVAAYEVVPDGSAGSRIRMVQHLNANVGMAEHVQFLWEKRVISMLSAWASELSEEARNIVAQRNCGKGGGCPLPGYDSDLLELLSPSPLQRNSSMTIAKVLSLAPKQVSFRRLATATDSLPHWQRAFGKLPLTTVLNVTQWDSFESRADEVMSLFRLVEHNATDDEKEAFASLAHDALDVQRQGEALASLQWRYLEVINRHDCDASLPDINGNTGNRAWSFAVVVAIAVAIVVLLLSCISCCCVKLYRIRRERQARQAASLLLSAASSCAPSDRAVAPTSEASTTASQGEVLRR